MKAPGENESGAISDEALMDSLQRGEDQALATLMDRWELGVKGFLLRLGVPSADVDDVAQEAFVRLYEKRANYRPGAAFKPWILTIAGNLGRNRLRWRFRRREESNDTVDVEHPGGFEIADPAAQSGSNAAETASLAQEVRTAVNALPGNLRHAVLCVDLEEMSHHEAALVMGCSPKAVETRLYRARQILRTALKSVLTSI